MRKSRQEAAKTRERIIASAAAEFREHGITATGLADFMKAAGLTHGGFYRHFNSKDQLVAESLRNCCCNNDRASSRQRIQWARRRWFRGGGRRLSLGETPGQRGRSGLFQANAGPCSAPSRR